MSSEATPEEAFTGFVREVELRLRRALVAALGVEAGREATADALTYGWEYWGRVSLMDNPAGYLYRVGRSKGRRYLARHPSFPALASTDDPLVEPGLSKALGRLSERQRVCVMLVHGYGWKYDEVGELLGIGPGTVHRHAERALASVRSALEVRVDA